MLATTSQIPPAASEGPAPRAAGIVADYFRDPIRALEHVAADLAGTLGDPICDGRLTAGRLDELVEPFAYRLFDITEVPVYGAGFIAAKGRLADAPGHLSWWQGDDRRKLVLAAQTVNKERIDYSELEWYRVPLDSGRTHVAGPYVDYLCSDEYTITIAAPVTAADVFAGVAAFDLLIDSVERQLVPQLDALAADVTLVNGVGRVVVSTDPRHATGDVIRTAASGSSRVPCPGVALDAIVTPRP